MIHPEDQLLSDLRWLLDAQEGFVLERSLSDFLVDDWQERLESLRLMPAVLVDHMAKVKSHFMGSYFEQLFSFAVDRFTSLEIIAEHQQINVEGKTLGEIDALVRTPQGEILQYEIALKFYLERADMAPDDWIGPNKNDSLRKKTTRARLHQLKILSSPEGRQWLSSVTGDENYQPNLLIYGRHFRDISNADCNLIAHSDSVAGWLRLSTLMNLQDALFDLTEVSKPYWITFNQSKAAKNQINTRLIEMLSLRFSSDGRPVLFLCKKQTDKGVFRPYWLFVCPDEW